MTLDSVGDVDEEGGRGRDQARQEEPETSAADTLAQLGDYDGKHSVGGCHSTVGRQPLSGHTYFVIVVLRCSILQFSSVNDLL